MILFYLNYTFLYKIGTAARNNICIVRLFYLDGRRCYALRKDKMGLKLFYLNYTFLYKIGTAARIVLRLRSHCRRTFLLRFKNYISPPILLCVFFIWMADDVMLYGKTKWV